MANGVPSSFKDLKKRAKERIQQGDHDVKSDIIDMGNAMLQAGVEPKNAQDRLAKNVWQAAGPQDKEMLADMVAQMAKDEAGLSE
ncbi:hypothetical protein Sulac_1547 [Sulfobacillus acidophilus DSM 10332]|uniref:DUF3243 domain-containing protein n=1 Tax=Sulfobacillus acidophilus (strain ATCC 700253 / DSM 10332 / NAL) TaxID=679936 RepID=G8TY80_SULAD|nr:hypothetical protein Sulac_1547 [Sulfobacillus acidophilus DSM 10332]MCY0864130.1 DUF3243 family protein [Sulfobacillus sp.]